MDKTKIGIVAAIASVLIVTIISISLGSIAPKSNSDAETSAITAIDNNIAGDTDNEKMHLN